MYNDIGIDNFYFFIFIFIIYILGYFIGIFIGKHGSKEFYWCKDTHIVKKMESEIKLLELEIKILEEKRSKIDSL